MKRILTKALIMGSLFFGSNSIAEENLEKKLSLELEEIGRVISEPKCGQPDNWGKFKGYNLAWETEKYNMLYFSVQTMENSKPFIKRYHVRIEPKGISSSYYRFFFEDEKGRIFYDTDKETKTPTKEEITKDSQRLSWLRKHLPKKCKN